MSAVERQITRRHRGSPRSVGGSGKRCGWIARSWLSQYRIAVSVCRDEDRCTSTSSSGRIAVYAPMVSRSMIERTIVPRPLPSAAMWQTSTPTWVTTPS